MSVEGSATAEEIIAAVENAGYGASEKGKKQTAPKAEKSARFDRLCDAQNRISEQIHLGYVGRTFRCLVDGRDKDQLTARTEGGRLVRFVGEDSLIGTYQHLTITGATTWSLTGELKR